MFSAWRVHAGRPLLTASPLLIIWRDWIKIHDDGITQPIAVVNSTDLFFLWNGDVIQIDIWLPTDSILELYDNIHAGKQQRDTNVRYRSNDNQPSTEAF
jgi:hypothetical protein